ncbi:hypothetical protein T492DRAFT_913591 [Pavlovales sp. CCMP2436]|nr:hypothetical protein T492DRAFT_913591 [Pavlovales sp. CCMP2436]
MLRLALNVVARGRVSGAPTRSALSGLFSSSGLYKLHDGESTRSALSGLFSSPGLYKLSDVPAHCHTGEPVPEPEPGREGPEPGARGSSLIAFVALGAALAGGYALQPTETACAGAADEGDESDDDFDELACLNFLHVASKRRRCGESAEPTRRFKPDRNEVEARFLHIADARFKTMFRMDRSAFDELCETLKPDLEHKTKRDLPVLTQVACALRYFAGGSHHDIGVGYSISASSHFRIIDRVIDAILGCKSLDLTGCLNPAHRACRACRVRRARRTCER